MTTSILICLAALFVLLWLLRRDRISLGLPLAYLALLLLNHVPGAFAHLVGNGQLYGTEFAATGIAYTAIGSVCFVIGVWRGRLQSRPSGVPEISERPRYWAFCLVGGWICVYGLSPLGAIPSVGAAVDKGGAVWILGVLLGLRSAVQSGNFARMAKWLLALLVYPVIMLLGDGFLSYGAAAIINAGSVIAISARGYLRAVGGVVLATGIALTVFVNYYEHRDNIRDKVWGGARLEQRIGSFGGMIRDFHLIDPGNQDDLISLDERLNQNFFIGVAAERIKTKQVDYLYGRSVWEGLMSLVPRAVWPDKPVFGGSPRIVTEMTGLELNQDTSWGVGNVMEFYINFGIPGLIGGFLVLGWILGWLDLKAAVAERRGELGTVFLYFLPAIALIQPIGSMVELTGGAAAALVAAYGWRWGWQFWRARRARSAPRFSSPGPVPRLGIDPAP